MALSDLIGYGNNSPEKRGEFLRLPETHFAFGPMWSRYSIVDDAFGYLHINPTIRAGLTPTKYESPQNQQFTGAMVEAQRAYEPIQGTDSIHDTGAGRIGNTNLNINPMSQAMFSKPSDQQNVAIQAAQELVDRYAKPGATLGQELPEEASLLSTVQLNDPRNLSNGA